MTRNALLVLLAWTPCISAADDIQELSRLKATIAEQQAQIEQLRTTLEQQSKLLDSMAARAAAPPPAVPSAERAPAPTEPSSPLRFRIGDTSITPVGFMDFTPVFRSTNPGTGIGTNFGSIPFNNVAQGRLTETRLSTQNSRLGLRLDAKVKGASVLGYMEGDFLGFVPPNASVTSNSVNYRLRLFWVDVRKGRWEFLGGQSWSLLTPNRQGLSALPSDLSYTQVIDVNYQNGLVWSRNSGFRVILHPNKTVALGVSLENPDQYIGGSGGGGLITLPSAFAGNNFSNEVNNGNTGMAAPALHPDVIVKAAFDPRVRGRALHLEIAGLERTFRTFEPAAQRYFTVVGGGGSVNVSFDFSKSFRLLSDNFYGSGVGRWMFGLAPDLIVRSDGSPSPVHSGSSLSGFEAQVKNTQLYGYYGGAYIRRNTAVDVVNGRASLIGYGYSGSPNTQNRNIQEITFGGSQMFWKDPKYGSLQFMAQYSYLLRHPWWVAAGVAGEAHAHMIFLNLRYALPGSAPTIQY